ncbi:MAG: hypothetical protein P9X24_04605 [Candidatus Hatepunaea meridiana]|nr:hypothetical protein [Candidatus Hatepunaea meridiana]
MNNPKVPWRFQVSAVLPGTGPASAGNYGKFFVANKKCVVKSVKAVWTTASTSGTLQLQRLQGTEAKASGDDLLSSTIDLSGTAETVNSGTLTTTVAYLILTAGDRLCLENGGTLTSGAGLCVTVELEQVD